MNIQIRSSIFETNSSAMHSIAVKQIHYRLTPEEAKKRNNIYIHADGKANIYVGDYIVFGEKFRILCSVMEKALYLIAVENSLQCGDYEATKQYIETQIYPVLHKIFPNFKGINFPEGEDGPFYGASQCTGLKQYLEKNNISVENFLLDSAYVVFIDGDNYNELGRFFEEKIINRNDFSEVRSFW